MNPGYLKPNCPASESSKFEGWRKDSSSILKCAVLYPTVPIFKLELAQRGLLFDIIRSYETLRQQTTTIPTCPQLVRVRGSFALIQNRTLGLWRWRRQDEAQHRLGKDLSLNLAFGSLRHAHSGGWQLTCIASTYWMQHTFDLFWLSPWWIYLLPLPTFQLLRHRTSVL